MSENRKQLFALVSKSSHKIGALLTIIKEGMSLVYGGEEGSVNHAQQRALLIANNAIVRLTHMVSDLIDLEKILSGDIIFRKEETKVYDLISYIGKSIHHELDIKKIAFKNTVSESVCSVYIDRDKTKRAIANILEEMLKVTPEESTITVCAKEEEQVVISLKSESIMKNTPAVFTSDMLKDNIETLLVNDKAHINIIIAKAIIEQQGGHMDLLKEEGNYNHIIFRLPRYSA
ncbi:MAG: hypothetical protein ABH868_03265 [bacterium]